MLSNTPRAPDGVEYSFTVNLFPTHFTMVSATTMQALNYLGPYKVQVQEVEKPKIEHPDDIIVKVTTVS